MKPKNIATCQAKIKRIKAKLVELGDMRPGSLSKQYNVCGNPSCRCKDTKNPKKHGPYYQLSYTYKGKSKTEFVKRERISQVKMELKNYRVFKKLVEEWIDLSLTIATLRRLDPSSQ